MTIEPLGPQDAPELLRIARERGETQVVVSPGAHGAVVRDGGAVRAYGLLRELPYGFVVDDLWSECGHRGKIALSLLSRWIEERMGEIARVRGEKISLGGIVRVDNPTHQKALERRGYAIVAHVLAKDFLP